MESRSGLINVIPPIFFVVVERILKLLFFCLIGLKSPSQSMGWAFSQMAFAIPLGPQILDLGRN